MQHKDKRYKLRSSRKLKSEAKSSKQKSSVRPSNMDRNFIPRLHLAKPSNRGARSLATRWKMSLRGRTNDDDRFCRRSLLLFLIFLWWPPTLYRLLSLVIPVLHASSFSLSFFSSFSSFFPLSIFRDFLHYHEYEPHLGVALENCLQGGVEKKDNLVFRWTKENRKNKQWLRNDHLEIPVFHIVTLHFTTILLCISILFHTYLDLSIILSSNNSYLMK